MELVLTDEQEFFRATTRKFLEAEVPLTVVRELEHDPAGFDRGWWRRGAGLGWTSMLVPEAFGGGSFSGDGLLDLVLVAEEMGRLVSPGPLLPVSAVAAAVAESGSPAQQAAVLAGIVAGDVVGAWCLAEPGGIWDPAGIRVEAAVDGDDVVLDGVKAPVEAAAQADWLLVSARTGDGLTQVLLPAGTPGVTITPMEGLDLVKRFAEVRFDRVRVPLDAVVGTVGRAAVDVEHQLQLALCLQAAETVGAADRVFERTVEYLDDRVSFGRPLASYQALKHRVADMKTWLEACQAIATGAAEAVARRTPQAAETAHAAKAYVGAHATEIIQEAVQLHGGIGMTWEHDLHLYLRRATVNRFVYGSPRDHLEQLAALIGLGAAAEVA